MGRVRRNKRFGSSASDPVPIASCRDWVKIVGMEPQPVKEPNPKRAWYTLFLSMCASVALFAGASFALSRPGATNDTSGGLVSTAYALAALMLLGSAAVAALQMRPRATMRGRTEWPAVKEFQNSTILSLALSEVATVLGFVIVGLKAPSEFMMFPAASLVVNLLVVLPRGMQFWSESGNR